MSIVSELHRLMRSTLSRVVEHERRIGAHEFRGRVVKVDGAGHRIKLVIGSTPEGDDVVGPWVPVSQVAGAMKFHDMPSVGQQGAIITANGDIEQGRFVPLHWSEGNEALSDDPGEKIMTLGAVTVRWDDSTLTASVGSSMISIEDGKVEITADLVRAVGASLVHNSKSVGDTHRHSGVLPGGATTDDPV